jgi:hypothetical protein
MAIIGYARVSTTDQDPLPNATMKSRRRIRNLPSSLYWADYRERSCREITAVIGKRDQEECTRRLCLRISS